MLDQPTGLCSMGPPDGFPLGIDDCYNCTPLVTCLLESLSLRPLIPCRFSGLFFISALLLWQVCLIRKHNLLVLCETGFLIFPPLLLHDPREHKSTNDPVCYIFCCLLIRVIISGGALMFTNMLVQCISVLGLSFLVKTRSLPSHNYLIK